MSDAGKSFEVRPAGRHNSDPAFRDAKGETGKQVFPSVPTWVLREQNTERPD